MYSVFYSIFKNIVPSHSVGLLGCSVFVALYTVNSWERWWWMQLSRKQDWQFKWYFHRPLWRCLLISKRPCCIQDTVLKSTIILITQYRQNTLWCIWWQVKPSLVLILEAGRTTMFSQNKCKCLRFGSQAATMQLISLWGLVTLTHSSQFHCFLWNHALGESKLLI